MSSCPPTSNGVPHRGAPFPKKPRFAFVRFLYRETLYAHLPLGVCLGMVLCLVLATLLGWR